MGDWIPYSLKDDMKNCCRNKRCDEYYDVCPFKAYKYLCSYAENHFNMSFNEIIQNLKEEIPAILEEIEIIEGRLKDEENCD